MTDVLRIDTLAVDFGDLRLFSAFTLHVPSGDKITLSGPSGCGKSTLLRCVMGFVPAAAGRIYVEEEALTAETVWHLRGRLAYLAQEPELGEGTVRDALVRPFAYRINQRLAYNEETALRLFEAFLLPASLIHESTAALSGGQKQRVALTGALLLQRPILLLDEAASALDKTAKQAVRDYLCERNELTILSVSHDVNEFALSGPVVDMKEGLQEKSA